MAFHDLPHAIGFPLVGGVDDDPIPDVGFHGDLPGGLVWCLSQPARPGGPDQGGAGPAARGREGQQMARYVQLGGVRTWYDEHGAGEPLVLMHGGLVDSRFLEPNLPPLAERFHVYTPDRRGHGHSPDADGPITYQLMADDTIAFLEPWWAPRRTWSGTATAPWWRCWSPCSGPNWSSAW
jgi:hypothetical protein